MPYKIGDKVKLKFSPSFSSKDRKGWIVQVVQRNGYVAVKDELGVSWPLKEDEVESI